MENEIQIILHSGALGASKYDDDLDRFLRLFAEMYSPNKDEEWAEKYGTDFENHKVKMYRFCWCEKETCPYCYGAEKPTREMINRYGIEKTGGEAPNFWYKPLDFKVWWYKYIGRGVKTNKKLSNKEFKQMIEDLLTPSKSINNGRKI